MGTPASSRQREDALHLGSVEPEVLGSGVQLDAARAGRQTAFALCERLFGRVEAAEGDQPPLALLRPGEHAVVGHAIGGPALGVVQREHARAPRAGIVELGEQLDEL